MNQTGKSRPRPPLTKHGIRHAADLLQLLKQAASISSARPDSI